jgi:hypothetical protein
MYYDWIQQHRRTVTVTVTAFIAVLVVWSAVVSISHIGKIPVNITVVPYDSTVTINGDKTGGGTHWLSAGSYTISSSKEGFASRQKKVVVTDQKKENVVSLALSPQSEEAKKWASDHARDYSSNEAYGAVEAQNNGKYFTDTHPIVKLLPYKDPYYQIDYERETDDSVTLVIQTPSPRYRYFAVQKIRDLGFDPTDYKVVFRDFTNPLEKKS